MIKSNLSAISSTESFSLAGLSRLSFMIALIEAEISLSCGCGDSPLVRGCAGDGSVGCPRCCEWFRPRRLCGSV